MVAVSLKKFAFEFVQSNLEILKKNLELNPLIKDIIEVVPSPLFDQDDKQLFIEERGPASSVHFEPPKNKKYASVVTSTIDSFVAKKELKKETLIIS